MTPGTRVTITPGKVDGRRMLRRHAKRGDVGTVVPRPAARGIPDVYVLVQFPGCPMVHKLLPDEIEVAR